MKVKHYIARGFSAEREMERRQWNAHIILQDYDWARGPRPAAQINEIIARIQAANQTEAWLRT